jgi:hypothetical protein
MKVKVSSHCEGAVQLRVASGEGELGYVLHRVAATNHRGDAQARELPMAE